MNEIALRRLLFVFMFMLSVSMLVGCANMEKRPEYRSGYLYYPSALVNADRALDEARAAGKDKECPEEFNRLKAQVDKAYEVYMACHTQEAIDMANDAIGKIKALCPPKPVAEVKPEPVPVPPPPPAPEVMPAAKAEIILKDVHFDFDKATLTDEAMAILKNNIEVIKANPGISISIEGNTCQHGKDDYNMRLGERRADAVKEYLAKEGGIDESRMTTISYGLTRPLCVEKPTHMNKNDECMKSNRRVHFEVIVK
ncbi:MAG: OmpA family protein [Dissulfurispiraceae bacterium]|jgi:outer membrane protein OmpA-like peptidoglycan-associated protein